MRNWSGTFGAPVGSAADRIHDGCAARSDIEDELDRWWGDTFDHVGHDGYDNSLEIYFEESVDDLEATPEQQRLIWEMGFNCFWLNFHGGRNNGGTDRRYSKTPVVPHASTPQ